MNRSKKGSFVIAIVCMITGAILLGVGFGLKGRLHSGWGVNFGRNFGIGVFNGQNVEETISLEPFESISLDVPIGDLKIKTGDSYKVDIIGYSSDNYELTNKDGELTFHYEQPFTLFNFNFDFVNDYEVIVYVPTDVNLKTITVDSSMGDVDMQDITCDHLQVNQAMGGVQLKNIEVEMDTEIDQKMGDITYSGILHGNSEFKNAMGDIDITVFEEVTNYRYELKTSMGTLKYKDARNGEKSNTTMQGGNQNATHYINAKNSMGDIELEFTK